MTKSALDRALVLAARAKEILAHARAIRKQAKAVKIQAKARRIVAKVLLKKSLLPPPSGGRSGAK